MPTRIFITGVSGYIGGQLATDLSKQHPELEIVGLVRAAEQAEIIRQKLPEISTVQGDLSSHEILIQEAQKADVVIQAADCDDVAAVKALIKGLSQGGGRGSFIQISGAASIIDTTNGYGQASSRIYDDVRDIAEITRFDSSHVHSEGDQAVIREGKGKGVKTAVLMPGMAFGEGEGPIKTKSTLLPWLKEAIVKRKKGFTIGEGKNSWAALHVKDLAAATIRLIEDALHPTKKATWGPEGFYYLAASEYVFNDIVLQLVEALNRAGLVKSLEIDQVLGEAAISIHPYALLLWGSSVRCAATRICSLDWKPTQSSLYETLPGL